MFFLFFSTIISNWTLDDSFISFRYTENLTKGNGLVFNKGEPVEGYSNFLWIYLLAAGSILNIQLVLWSKVLGICLALGTLILVFLSYRFHPAISRTHSALGAFLLATCGIFSPWGMSGLETSLYTFLLTSAFLFYISIRQDGKDFHFFVLGVWMALVWLTRPDGILFIIVFFADTLIRSAGTNWKRFFYFSGSFLLVYGPYFLWRFFYYGYPFPNTFYAKVGYTWHQFLRGLDYTKAFLFTVWPFVLLLLLGIFIHFMKRNRKTGRFLSGSTLPLCPTIFMIFTFYITAVGGDFMPAYRFYAPLMPILILWAIQMFSMKKPVWLIILLIITFNNIYQTFFNNEIYRMISDYQLVAHGKMSGEWLKKNCPPSTILATNTIGSVPYYSDLYAIDMLGITDSHIAHRQLDDMGRNYPGHEKGDGTYILKRYPDIILFGGPLGSAIPVLRSDFELSKMPLFYRLYQFITMEIQPSIFLKMYIKKTFLKNLNPALPVH